MRVLFFAFLAATLVGNFVGYVLILRDKQAAKRRGRRRPEDTFSLLALLGWWPGMVVAMRRARHKTKKSRFLGQLAFSAAVGTVLWVLVALILWSR